MSDKQPLRIVDPERDRILQFRAARGARIDKLLVDRSRYQNLPLGHWSIEAQSPEARLEAIRAETTVADKMDAWRELFRKYAKASAS